MHKAEQYRPFAGGYVSEFDRFLRDYNNRHPDLGESQQRGGYLLWDKNVDLEDIEKSRADSVPEKPYHYE
ncbi:MAG: DUF3460 family protein [Pseudomonadota bacterium]